MDLHLPSREASLRVGDAGWARAHPCVFASSDARISDPSVTHWVHGGRPRGPEAQEILLCSDVIETPSLAAQLRHAPEALGLLLMFLARRIAGEKEAEALARETEAWITAHLGADYAWPGNVRELEQCVRNIMIRGAYRPARAASPGVHAKLADAFVAGAFTVEELMRRYCTLVFAQTGNYQETARRLGIDWRTVKEKLDRSCSTSSPGPMVGARTMASILIDEDTGTMTPAP